MKKEELIKSLGQKDRELSDVHEKLDIFKELYPEEYEFVEYAFKKKHTERYANDDDIIDPMESAMEIAWRRMNGE